MAKNRRSYCIYDNRLYLEKEYNEAQRLANIFIDKNQNLVSSDICINF